LDFPVRVIQRGNNRQSLFTSDAEIAAYAHWLAEGAMRFRVDVHGGVFMTHHTHLLVTPRTDNGVSRLMQSLGRRYVGYFNYSYARSCAERQKHWRRLAGEAMDADLISRIRHCTNTGLVLGKAKTPTKCLD